MVCSSIFYSSFLTSLAQWFIETLKFKYVQIYCQNSTTNWLKDSGHCQETVGSPRASRGSQAASGRKAAQKATRMQAEGEATRMPRALDSWGQVTVAPTAPLC